MAKTITINLKAFFDKEARKSLIPAQKKMITEKRGVRMDAAPINKPSTVKQKGFDHWLKATDETRRTGFEFESTPNRLTLFANENRHSGRRMYKGEIKASKREGPQYSKLIEWHTDKYSGLYTQLPVGSRFPERMVTEIYSQIAAQARTHFNRKWHIKLG